MNEQAENNWLYSLDEESFEYYKQTLAALKEDRPQLTFNQAHAYAKEYTAYLRHAEWAWGSYRKPL